MKVMLTAIRYFGKLNYYEGVDKLSLLDWLYKYRISWNTAYKLSKVINDNNNE